MEDQKKFKTIWCTLIISFFYTRIGVNKYFKGFNVKIVTTLALGLRPRQRACKVASQEGSLGVTSHAPKSVKSVRE